MEKFSALKILNATKSFVIVRAIVYSLMIAAMLVVGILGIVICSALWKASPTAAYIVFLIFFGGLYAILKFAQKYFLYMIKAAHVAAITEYIKTGAAPVTVKGYKGVVAYGTEKIKNNFKEANIAFVADALIAGATRQIMYWLNTVQNLFSFIPGADKVMKFVNFVLSTALNYIDEAVLSYVFYHDEEPNGFKKACDGLVYYAQSWKGMLMGALKVAGFVWILRFIVFIIFYALVNLLVGAIFSSVGMYYFALVIAWILLYGIEAIVVEPVATVIMINDYHKAIDGQPLKSDLHGTLCKVSQKFRSLFEKSNQPMPTEPAEIPTSL